MDPNDSRPASLWWKRRSWRRCGRAGLLGIALYIIIGPAALPIALVALVIGLSGGRPVAFILAVFAGFVWAWGPWLLDRAAVRTRSPA